MGMVNEIGGEYFPGFTSKVQKALLSYAWPGNVRELKNVIERAVYQHGEQKISDLIFNPFESPYRIGSDSKVATEDDHGVEVKGNESITPVLESGQSLDFKDTVQNFEIALIKQAMEQSQFNQKTAAEQLNLSYHQLRGYLRKYDLLG